jgi:hypothetical protein
MHKGWRVIIIVVQVGAVKIYVRERGSGGDEEKGKRG